MSAKIIRASRTVIFSSTSVESCLNFQRTFRVKFVYRWRWECLIRVLKILIWQWSLADDDSRHVTQNSPLSSRSISFLFWWRLKCGVCVLTLWVHSRHDFTIFERHVRALHIYVRHKNVFFSRKNFPKFQFSGQNFRWFWFSVFSLEMLGLFLWAGSWLWWWI